MIHTRHLFIIALAFRNYENKTPAAIWIALGGNFEK